jgi:hypothetical protein
MPKAIKYTFVVIGVYLGVRYASGASMDIKSLTSGGGAIVTDLQGR